ncbi:protein-L-isoaspartate(D-aspartate) O-methyltransferase [Roseibium sediminicola]|uniref:Protein-L-isoaspartate O-methyltransferase n=1 Tax=Roseibium sediminicola TaxID=2933272 RepID=A0ABT0GQY3_9HYPH|nr:protein-L-isoaspartate(D-aspartate) O-methyltransferase [Roseibium sp. CAU 1639]MCK7611487.1 protein-L-isoaspartate(D-aspartate) O-methyltransferase [Roseibium sp. CAU 1639]
MDPFAAEREAMVEIQLRRRGIHDDRVLAAMAKVPRHLFVPENHRHNAYWDGPLPIGSGQTISQPYVVALTCELLEIKPEDNVLDIGAGSGYAAAVLAELAARVVSIERLPELTDLARSNLEAAGYGNVEVLCADGTLGCPDKAPFDAIAVAAGAPAVPASLKQQLKVGGRLVIPVGTSKRLQDLVRVRRVSEQEFKTEDFGGVAYVPLVGAEGWSEGDTN